MATFINFSNILPDPVNKITEAGDIDSTGTEGPGFKSVSLKDIRLGDKISRSRSGRGVSASNGAQMWAIDISYNKMTRDQFDVVDSFLSSRNGRTNPFFVILPQVSKPKDSLFYAYCMIKTIQTKNAVSAGSTSFEIQASDASVFSGMPSRGDFININDATDINHLKAYKITRVESPLRYQAGTTQPTRARIHVDPPIIRDITQPSEVVFINPKFRVIQESESREQEIDTEGLYTFSLSLEEFLP